MLAELEKGYIGAVMVKDLSRLARDHIQADTLVEEFFPEHDIRLISVSEGLDTAEGEDEFTPFRNLMKKIRCLRRVFATPPHTRQTASIS